MDRVTKEVNWKYEADPTVMWKKMENCITLMVKEKLGESRGMASPCKDTSWWNKKVKAVVKNKQI